MAFEHLTDITKRLTTSTDRPRRVAVISAEDARVLEAVAKARREGVVEPVLIGNKEGIVRLLKDAGEDTVRYRIIDEPNGSEAAYLAIEMIRNGSADFLMKGSIHTSVILKTILNKERGLPVDGLMSSLCILEIPKYHKLLAITDGAIVIQPDLNQKKLMIENTVRTLRAMGYERPKVAALTATESVSPRIQDTLDAAMLKEMNQRGEIPDCVVEGPISLDLALDREACRTKGFKSEVGGDADLVLAPNITAANALIKSLRLMGGAESANLVLGSKVPIVLTSRGASVKTKYLSLLVTAAAV